MPGSTPARRGRSRPARRTGFVCPRHSSPVPLDDFGTSNGSPGMDRTGSAVQALADRLGVRLLNRTTRTVSLTGIGQDYYERSVHVLTALEEADRIAGALQATPQGTLRLHSSMSVVRFLAPVISEFVGRDLGFERRHALAPDCVPLRLSHYSAVAWLSLDQALLLTGAGRLGRQARPCCQPPSVPRCGYRSARARITRRYRFAYVCLLPEPA